MSGMVATNEPTSGHLTKSTENDKAFSIYMLRNELCSYPMGNHLNVVVNLGFVGKTEHCLCTVPAKLQQLEKGQSLCSANLKLQSDFFAFFLSCPLVLNIPCKCTVRVISSRITEDEEPICSVGILSAII